MDPKFPRQRSGAWDKTSCLRYAVAAKRRAMKSQSSPYADLRRTKLEKEIQLLTSRIKAADHELSQAQGTTISQSACTAFCLTLTGLLCSGLEVFCSWVTCEFRDASLTSKAQEVRDRTKLFLQAQIRARFGEATTVTTQQTPVDPAEGIR
jgi:hypothetical protein